MTTSKCSDKLEAINYEYCCTCSNNILFQFRAATNASSAAQAVGNGVATIGSDVEQTNDVVEKLENEKDLLVKEKILKDTEIKVGLEMEK